METMKLNLEIAKQIAEREIEERRAASAIFSRFPFTPVEVDEETERFWVFVAGAEELFDEGVIPNAIYVCVDKLDGHIWSREEQEQFYEQQAQSVLQPVARVA
jgi:hypothetical protein